MEKIIDQLSEDTKEKQTSRKSIGVSFSQREHLDHERMNFMDSESDDGQFVP